MKPKVSVIISTHNRLNLLRHCLNCLERQTVSPEFYEVVVVVDGSTDGTAEFVRDYRPAFPFSFFILEKNSGQPVALNKGIAIASADLVIILDDDTLPESNLVEVHNDTLTRFPGSFSQGALLMSPAHEGSLFLRYQKFRLKRFHEYQRKRPETLTGVDVSSGNCAIRRSHLIEVGGFNEDLNRLTNIDGDLVHRLENIGVKLRYSPAAMAYLTHMKDMDGHLKEASLYGRAYIISLKRDPRRFWKHSPWIYDSCSILRNGFRRRLIKVSNKTGRFPDYENILRKLTRVFESSGSIRLCGIIYRLNQDYYFWKGIFEESGGNMTPFMPKPVPILCYHNVSDHHRPEFRLYILSRKKFASQMRWIRRLGFEPITLDTLCAYLEQGAPIPERPALITFDDGYKDLKENAEPILGRMKFPHVHFINTGKLGGTTDWIPEADDLPLLNAEDIREMARSPFADFQAHGKNHLSLENKNPETIRDEVGHSIDTLENLLNRPVKYLAYPFGDYDANTVQTVSALPLRCSFTVDQGLCRPGQDLHRLPRVEIFSNDLFIDFLLKLYFGKSPIASLRTRLKRIYKKIRARVFVTRSPKT